MNLINNNNMEFSTDNLGKPSNKKMELIANIALYSLPLLVGAIAILQPIAPQFVIWANFALTVATVVFKGISKFTAEVEQPAE